MTEQRSLNYASPTTEHAGARSVAIAAFVIALFAPLIAGGMLYGVSTFGFDIDDTLPRSAAILFVFAVAVGVPLSAVVAGSAAAVRLGSGPRRTLAKAAVVIGALWGVATFIFLSLGFAA
jgi:hypothetical protein